MQKKLLFVLMFLGAGSLLSAATIPLGVGNETFVADMIELYPEYEYELDFISDYISSLCSIPQSENDGSYATGVLHLISMSGVSVDMKKRLGNAVIAGNASARLWNFN